MNLNQVTLPVSNIQTSINFYRTMGFEPIVIVDHYARFACSEGNSTFSLHLEGCNMASGVVVYFECQDLDCQVQKLQQKGLIFSQTPKDEPWLWREARLLDPDNNEICLYWAGENRLNPPWRIKN